MLGWKKSVKVGHTGQTASPPSPHPGPPRLADVLSTLQQLHHNPVTSLTSSPCPPVTSTSSSSSSLKSSLTSSLSSSLISTHPLPSPLSSSPFDHRRFFSSRPHASPSVEKKKKRWFHFSGDSIGEDIPPSTPPSSSPPSLSFFTRKHSKESSTSSPSIARIPPAAIITSFNTPPPPLPPRPSLRLSLSAIVIRSAFASSFRSFLAQKYCEENIDFLVAVDQWTKVYEKSHPQWRRKEKTVEFSVDEKVKGGNSYLPLDLETDHPPSLCASQLPCTALGIYQTYILLTGPHTVNIPAHTRLRIEQAVSSLQPLPASSLTPAIFDEAANEITALLEREWLTKFYATPAYAALVQLMDKKERYALLKEQASRAKRKVNQQLKRVAAIVAEPNEERLQIRVGEQRLTYLQPGVSPVTPISPVSSLRPSAVRQVGNKEEEKEAEEELVWWRIIDSTSPCPLSPPSPSSPSPSLLPTPSTSRDQFNHLPTPPIPISPRPMKVTVRPSATSHSPRSAVTLFPSACSTASLASHACTSSLPPAHLNTSLSSTSPPHTRSHTPSTTSSGRRPPPLTPIPYPHADNAILHFPLSALSSGGEEESPLFLVTHHDEEAGEEGREREGSVSPEPSTASDSPSPLISARLEGSRSGEVRKEDEEEGSEGEKVEDKVGEDEGGRFFSILVREERREQASHY